MKIYHQELKYLLFIDIETVSCASSYQALPIPMQSFWDKRAKIYQEQDEAPAEAFEKYAALHAEFCQIVSIGLGFFYLNEHSELGLRVKSISNRNEKQLLQEFKDLLEKRLSKRKRLVAHNGREFDYPFLCRRMLIHGLGLPAIFQYLRNKPWDNPHLDTMEMWRFGDRKSYSSLRLLAHLLGLPPYHDAIDGSMVSSIYYKDTNLERIAAYCRNDVITTAQLYLCLQNLPIVKQENITEVS
jgi:predicted PolB exonuclease-like 3'-5' exonuclease